MTTGKTIVLTRQTLVGSYLTSKRRVWELAVSASICVEQCFVPCRWLAGEFFPSSSFFFFFGEFFQRHNFTYFHKVISLGHESLYKMLLKYFTGIEASNSFALVKCYMFSMLHVLFQIWTYIMTYIQKVHAAPHGSFIFISQTVSIV